MIEGKFGQSKRRFSLARVMAKLASTSETLIMVAFMVMNLEKILSGSLYFLLYAWRYLRVSLQASAVYVYNLHLMRKIGIRIPQLKMIKC